MSPLASRPRGLLGLGPSHALPPAQTPVSPKQGVPPQPPARRELSLFAQDHRTSPPLSRDGSVYKGHGFGDEPKSASVCGGVAVMALMLGVVLLQAFVSATSAPLAVDPSTLDGADTTWVLVATMGVLMMVPGLGLFEAGLLRAKNSVSVLMQCFVGLAVLSVLWFVIGFSLSFAPSAHGLVGSPWEFFFFSKVPWQAPLPGAPTIPGALFAAFQGMFAVITPLLCTGAFAERLRFEAFLVFIVLWSLVVYYPLCHLVWGGGWLGAVGVVDFAGGIVIHTAAGVASLVTAIRLGPREGFTGIISAYLTPHNLPMAATGAGLLWFGWFAFNGGCALSTGALASSTLMTTHIAGSTGAVAWLILDWFVVEGRPTFVGVINGALSGLAGVTPASGFIPPSAGFVVGFLCGVGSYVGVHLFKERLRIDDALDVSSIHGVTGAMGSILLGVYASRGVNPDGPEGSMRQVLVQTFGVLVAIVWSAIGTHLSYSAVECIMPTRINKEEETYGLDRSQHGESSYLDLQSLV
jgi:Amt family ammonium transporter